MFCLYFPAHNLNFQWRWRWLDQIQATFLKDFYFTNSQSRISAPDFFKAREKWAVSLWWVRNYWKSRLRIRKSFGFKVQIFWEGHNIWKKNLALLGNVKKIGRFFQTFVAFSDYLNFTTLIFGWKTRKISWSRVCFQDFLEKVVSSNEL